MKCLVLRLLRVDVRSENLVLRFQPMAALTFQTQVDRRCCWITHLNCTFALFSPRHLSTRVNRQSVTTTAKTHNRIKHHVVTPINNNNNNNEHILWSAIRLKLHRR